MPDNPAVNDDLIMVSTVLRGDTDAFRRLINKYEKLVISIVFKMVKQREDCEDLCQDIFIKVYDKLPTFKFQSQLSTWIGSIAYNTTINFLQKKKLLSFEDSKSLENNASGIEEQHEMLIMDTAMNPNELLLSKEKVELVNRCVEQLPFVQKTVLQLFHHDEMSLVEISEITGFPLNTVKSHLFRARKQLKEELVKYLYL
ncbi:MAG TPA: sigma-70 family RNA polymerase sigma factor [Saprospiraceae bacterium]|nr:sigma-70 family RNA polymerase sigma factor [Saprospiraceae bacterium]